MIATITVQSHRMATQTQQDHHRFSNTAGSALPIIPRRPSHMRPALTHSPSLPLPTHSSLSTTSSAFSSSSSSTTVTPSSAASHHDDDTSSSSSNSSASDGSRPTIRTRRVRGVSTAPTRNGPTNAMCPPELSTPIPTISTTNASPSGASSAFAAKSPSDSASAPRPPSAGPSRPMLYTPGMPLRLSMDALSSASRNVSSTHVSFPTSNNTNNSLASAMGSKSASALCETFGEERPIRKKSGALVKSSLKSSSRSRSTSSLAVYASPMSSKSEPGTPSSKVVHFDAKLEHVKLFLAEQKPLAVSRDGSPTDDTSGTDSDFPRFIFGSSVGSDGGDDNKRLSRKRLVMNVANMPVRPAHNDVALEELCLGPDGANILGKVRVRNLAFSKSIAVRFTFDSWQTTSEVTGKYFDSPSPTFDRFAFTIRLNDLLARIEGKTLLLAVRYSVEGREIWDNNGGQNYLATFSKVKSEPPPGSDDEMSSDLRSRLEKVVQSKDRTGPAFAASRRHQPVTADADSFRTSASFASRYDFATSLKSSWNPALHNHNRTQSFPLPNTKSSPSTILWPQKTPPSAALGSPRDKSDEVFPQASFVTPEPHSGRNHSRSYFNHDSPSPPLLRRTPSATPPSEFRGTSPPRYNSFPPMESRTMTTPTPLPSTTTRGPLGYDIALVPDSGDSELSTPSMVTPSSSRDSSPSPTESLLSPEDEVMSPETHYRQFLNKFCFFTGPGSTLEQRSPSPSAGGVIDGRPRTHSASDIQELLSIPSGISPRIEGLSSVGLTPSASSLSPTRSSSLDDLMLNRSGSLTPTVSRLSMASSVSAFENHVGTPVF
ncbi:carbohydrate-binding module family 21 protein [Hebeloma cylindrosporum]|uniref:Carbohydrate-binding module family 21 protein n=1 Tax=Hebeloma cylindrosporum TaxID=76867 RepID=A0A0C2YIJ7_HEBCY|nr:carbohydrate-binding module family 21 protein [Hebeloma cylindrosporum h7]